MVAFSGTRPRLARVARVAGILLAAALISLVLLIAVRSPLADEPFERVPSGQIAVTTALYAGAGRLHILNAETGYVVATKSTGYQPQIAASPTERAVFVMSIPLPLSGETGTGRGEIEKLILPTLDPVWRVPISSPLLYQEPRPSTILASPDGSRIYVLESSVAGVNQAQTWITVLDAGSGRQVKRLDLDSCGVAFMTQPANGQQLFVVCSQTSDLRVFSTKGLWRTAVIRLPSGELAEIAGVVATADGRSVVIVSQRLAIVLVDPTGGRVEVNGAWQLMDGDVLADQVALSPNGVQLWVATRSNTTHLIELDSRRHRTFRTPEIHSFSLVRGAPVYATPTQYRLPARGVDSALTDLSRGDDVVWQIVGVN
jgi:outer membrane protein assembly factor BamB